MFYNDDAGWDNEFNDLFDPTVDDVPLPKLDPLQDFDIQEDLPVEPVGQDLVLLNSPQPTATCFNDTEWHPVSVINVDLPGASVETDDMPAYGTAPAFQEEPCVHIAYLNAVIGNVYANLSIVQATTMLTGNLDSLEAGGILPEHLKPVWTLESAKR